MGEYPWNMHRAKDYLWNWVQQNKSQKWPRPRDLTWVVAHVEEYKFSELPYTDEWKKFAPARPVPVWVTRAPTHSGWRGGSPSGWGWAGASLAWDKNQELDCYLFWHVFN